MRWIAVLFLPAVLLLAAACGGDEADERNGEVPTATVEAGAANTVEPLEATDIPPPPEPSDTPPPPPEPTDTPIPPAATDTPIPPEPTEPPLTNRRNCEAIRGTDYLSAEERDWFLANCQPPTQPPPPQQPPPAQACHPSYEGACLDPNASDYDCAGGTGNGPLYTGRVRVVGPDVFDLDRDGDGIGCE